MSEPRSLIDRHILMVRQCARMFPTECDLCAVLIEAIRNVMGAEVADEIRNEARQLRHSGDDEE